MSEKTNPRTMKNKRRWNFTTDMPLVVLFFLAFISMPRVVLHDLKLVPFDSVLYLFTAIAPLVVYLGVAVFRNNKRPMYDFVVMGTFYGVMLAAVHLVLWDIAGSGHGLALGDNLTGVLDPAAEAWVFKVAVAHSSILTGVVIGIVFGGVSVLSQKVKRRMAANA